MTPIRRRSFPFRRRSRWALGMVLVLTVFAPWLTAAQDSFSSIATYRSSEFGYLLWWDSTDWSIEDEETEAGSDLIQLGSDTASVLVWGYTEPGVTPRRCIEDSLAVIADDTDLIRFEAIDPPGNDPLQSVWGDDFQTSVELVLGFDVADGPLTVADFESCTAIGPDHIIATTRWMIAETFNALEGRFGETPRDTLTLPRSAWTFAPGASHLAERVPAEFGLPVLVTDPAAGERGLLTYRGADCVYGFRTPTLVIENTAASSWVVSPDALDVRNADGSHAPSFTHWLLPRVDSSNAVVLNQGDMAVLAFDFPRGLFGDLVYLTPWGESLAVSGFGLAGCGGGGAPVLIDLE